MGYSDAEAAILQRNVQEGAQRAGKRLPPITPVKSEPKSISAANSVRFTVYGDPLPKGSVRAFLIKGRPVLTSATRGLKEWEHRIAAAGQTKANGVLMTGPVHLRIAFYLTRPASLPKKTREHIKRPDLDKLVRGATDALTGAIWKDDAQLVSIIASKHYTAISEEAPRAEFIIEEQA